MKVLLAVSGDGASNAVVDAARRVFGDDATFVVVCVIEPDPIVVDPLRVVPPYDAAGHEDVAGREAAELAALVVADRASGARVAITAGDPSDRIAETAEIEDADVIVVGYHDKSLLSRLLDPPVAHALLHRTSRPMLVVPT